MVRIIRDCVMEIRQLPLILTIYIVNFGWTSAQTLTQMDNRFQNFFGSIVKNNTENIETYHEILKQDVARERQTFDTMKVELEAARNRNVLKKINSHQESTIDEDTALRKRDAIKVWTHPPSVEDDSDIKDVSQAMADKDFSALIAVASLDEVKSLVDEGRLDIHEANEECFGDTPIHEAARLNRLEILKYFIEEKGGDINVRNEFGEPPIFLAADRDRFGIIQYLVARGANITMTDEHKNNVLYNMARKGSIASAKFLLDEKKVPLDVNWKNNLNATIVHYAAKYNELKFLKYLIGQKKANIHARDSSGRTALHMAAESNSFDVIKYLLKQGANPAPKDIYGRKPSEIAREQNIINYLETMSG